jgi:hypothetical protein
MRQSRTMTAPKQTRSSNGGDDTTSAMEAELVDRLIASAAGLPRVCAFKRCRRAKRCFAGFGSGEVPCLFHHRGLARTRFASALKRLGWNKPRAHPSTQSVVAR